MKRISLTDSFISIVLVFLILMLFFIYEFMATEHDLRNPEKPLNLNTMFTLKILLDLLLISMGSIITTILRLRLRTFADLLLFTLTLGVPALILFSFLLSLFKLLNTIILLTLLIIGMTLFAKHVYSILRVKNNRVLKKEVAVILAIIVFLEIHFTRIAYTINVIPPGDAVSYGMLSSLIAYNNGIPATYEPIINISFFIPQNILRLGVPLLSATLTVLSKVYPIHTLIVVATTISFLISLLLFVAILRITNNVVISFLSLATLMTIPSLKGRLTPPLPNADILLGNLINGTYPQHLANLLFLLSAITIVLYQFKLIEKKKLLIILAFIFAATILSSPRPIPIMLILLLLTLSNRSKVMLLTDFILLLFAFLGVYICGPIVKSMLALEPIKDSYMSLNLLFNNRLYHLIFITMTVFCIIVDLKNNLVNKENTSLKALEVSFLIITLLLMFSMSRTDLYEQFFWILSTRRSFTNLYMLSILLYALCLHKLMSRSHYINGTLFLLMIIVFESICFHGLITSVTFISPAWQRTYNPEYTAILMLLKVAKPNDVIMHDLTWVGYSIDNFRPQKLLVDRTFVMMLRKRHDTLAKDYIHRYVLTIKLLTNPRNRSIFETIIKKYNVKYLFISRFNEFYDYLSGRYRVKVLRYRDYEQYLRIFDSYKCLETIFSKDKVRVYKVIKGNCS